MVEGGGQGDRAAQRVTDEQRTVATERRHPAAPTGRGDGFLTDEAVGLYIAQRNDKLVMQQGKLPGSDAVAGIVVAKDNTALAAALRLALKSLAEDGTYAKIFADYHVADMAFSTADLAAAH